MDKRPKQRPRAWRERQCNCPALLELVARCGVAIDTLRRKGVNAVFHYVPLHSSPVGRQLGRASGPMGVTDWAADRLVRLPLWIGLETQQDYVIGRCRNALGG